MLVSPLAEGRYVCRREALGRYAERFVPLTPDEENRAWLAAHPPRRLDWLQRSRAQLLAPFVSLYDLHGLAGGHPMHLLSTAQLRALLGVRSARWLDVGAGGGFVTRYAEPLATEIVCTETSAPLARCLARRGYQVIARDLGEAPLDPPRTFDAIQCLNVLDRTPYPRRLLRALRPLAAPGAPLLFALPLPLAPAVMVAGGSAPPAEALPEAQGSFEQGMRVLCERLFEPAGYEIERLARAPYLSQGDADQPVYALDAALFVLRAAHRT